MKIQVQTIEHRGEKRIRLDFERDERIISKIKRIKGRKWSQTKRCWHLPYTRAAFEELKVMFGEDLVLPDDKKVFLEKNENENIASTTPSETIQVLPEHQHRVKVLVPWQRKDWIEKIKNLPDRAWNMEEKYWSVPKNKTTLWQLQQWFGAALEVDTTIQWKKKQKSLGEKMAGIFRTVEASDLPIFENTVAPQFMEIERYGQSSKVVTGNQVIVQQKSEEWLMVFVPYDKKGWVEIVKTIDGRRWNSDESCWLIPYVKDSLDRLRQINALHFSLEVRADIPEYFPKKEKVKKKSGKDLLNEMQQKAITALEEKLLLERKSWRTIKTYKNLLIALLLYYPKTKPSSISEQQISRYFLHKIKNHHISVNTQGQMINAYKAFFERVLEQSGKVTVRRPKKSKQFPNVFSKEEIRLLLKAVGNQKHKAILALVYSAGLRRGEVLNLRVNDILFSRKCIFVKSGKGRKDRYVLLSEKAATLLKAYIKVYGPKYWLFEGEKGGKYSETAIQNIFQRAKKKAMVNTYVTLHGLRHSFATHLLENNVPLSAIQEMLGHASIKTTEIYLHISDQFRKQLKSPLDDIDFE